MKLKNLTGLVIVFSEECTKVLYISFEIKIKTCQSLPGLVV